MTLLVLIILANCTYFTHLQADDFNLRLKSFNKLVSSMPIDQKDHFAQKLKREHPYFYGSVTAFINAPWGIGRDQLIEKLVEGDFLEKKLAQLSLEQTIFFIRDIRNYWDDSSLITIFEKNPEKYAKIGNKFLQIIEMKIKEKDVKTIQPINDFKQKSQVTSPDQKQHLPLYNHKYFLKPEYYDALTAGTNHQLILFK